METRTVTQREQEEQLSQLSHSIQMSSQIKKKTFTSRETLMETMTTNEKYQRQKWTLFGNEAEKTELAVIRSQRVLRTRIDRMALRQQAEKKANSHIKYLEQLSRKAPDFLIPLRAHTVWEGMTVLLCCKVQGCPTPKVSWFKNGKPLIPSAQPWNYSFQQKFGLVCLQIRRCSPGDAGEYKVVAKSSLGDAMTFGTLVVNSYHGAMAGSDRSQNIILHPDAHFDLSFPTTWVKEGTSLTLQCSFTSTLLPFQQDVLWFRDGVQLKQSEKVDIITCESSSTMTLHAAHKEHEGVYTARLKTWDGTQDHSAFVYVTDASAAVLGGPASPLAVQVTDINKDYVFLSWQPPSADGASLVEGYYVERCVVGQCEWVRCNKDMQKLCHFPVFGLKAGVLYQFRVCAVNKAGVGRPSKATEPILTADPLEPSRTMVVKMNRGGTVTITKDEVEGEVKVPYPPTNVHACEVSDTYVVLSWDEPEPRGREPLSFYVERSLAGGSSWELASLDMEVNSPRFPVFDLVKDEQYCFRVRSINKFGVSEPSEPSPPISLGKPQTTPARPHSVMTFRDTNTSVQLQWKEPEHTEDILGYYVYYSEADTNDWKTVNNKPVKKNRFTVHGLKTGKEYVFRVKSVSHAGNSDYSNQSEPIVVKQAIHLPSAPSAIALLLCTESEMVLGWRAPSDNGATPVRGYYLDQREKEETIWREVNVKASKERKLKVCNLTCGHEYQFRVFAANKVGVGKPSEPSDYFLCEKWTMPEPGCPYDLGVREVRDGSLVLLWEAPLYEGRGPVNGYFLEVSIGTQSEEWTALNDNPIIDTHFKVSGLETGQTYRFRVSAANEAGVGCPSLPTEPIVCQTSPGTKNIEIGVDDDGFIFLGYEVEEMNDESEFLWNKNYSEPIKAGRVKEETKENKSILTFTDPSEEDLGLYTVELSDNPQMSSSYDFTAEDLDRLKDLSWQIRNPLIALKSGWQIEVSEIGNVRLWLQTESLSDEAELHLVFNDQVISSTPRRKINLDKAKGLVEVLFEQLAPEDEGSYTAQLRDGRAKNQFTLVFVDKKFRETFALADARRRDYKRKFGPYFEEFLSWSVNEDCKIILKCKVTNTTTDSSLRWFKDDMEVKQAVYEKTSGVSTLTINQVTKKDAGCYRVVVSDKRGEDVSILKLQDDEYNRLLQRLSKQCALSAGPLKVQSTTEGLRLYCSLKYYVSFMKNSWFFKEKKLDQEARVKSGSSTQEVWMDISNPSEKDKGCYTLEMFDGNETHRRSLDLTGKVFEDALLEHQRLKQQAIADKKRARVLKGLPDVVAIMEEKSLCLTCFIDGDPDPEVSWFRNDKEIFDQTQFTITKEPKCSTITINNVKTEDSGNYSIVVRNQHGSDRVDVTVSVYKRGEKPPANAVKMG
uniref:Myomesin-3-like n=1 Tax=Gouania willdenowi TaxID=441366 RepID=A0A8C5E8X9_GOUWI